MKNTNENGNASPAKNFLWSGKNSVVALIVSLTFLFSAVFLAYILCIYNNSFVHPQSVGTHLPKIITDGIGFKWNDFCKVFLEYCPGENRTRFLAYLFVIIDLHIHLLLERYFVLHPAFSISWILQIIITPYCLYMLLINLTGDRESSLVGILPFFTSVGFLSCFTMYLQPTKSMANIVILLALYLTFVLEKSAKPGQLLFEIQEQAKIKAALGILLLIGPFFDEQAYAAYFALPIIFSHLFFPQISVWQSSIQNTLIRFTKNSLFFVAPFCVFLILVIGVIPSITMKLYHYRLDFIAGITATGSSAGHAKSLTEGLRGVGFGTRNLYENFRSLLGVSVAPWQFSPLLKDPTAGGGVITGQTSNWIQGELLSIFIIAVVWGGFQMMGRKTTYLWRFVAVVLCYIFFTSLIQGRHVPFVIGYYYGSALPIFMAPIFALVYSAARERGEFPRFVALFAIVMIVLIQANNFIPINQSYVVFHNQWMTRGVTFKIPFKVAKNRPVTRKELNTIFLAWKSGQLSNYLNEHTVSPGAIYLLADYQYIDKFK